MRKVYFRPVPGAPAPLCITTEREVRFEEVDAMRIVWHGRYASYFEDGRVALGKKYGIGYADFIREQVPVPIRQMTLDFVRPLQFGERFEVETRLHWSDAARINFEYVIRNAQGESVCTGCTVQMMLNNQLEVLLTPPPFFAAFLARWKQGDFA
jgi:acyl-CoA thioester hydrolase